MQLQAGCDVITDGELGRLSYIGIIAEVAHGLEIVTLADGRPYTVVVEELRPKTEGILAAEARRVSSILSELGSPDHPYLLLHLLTPATSNELSVIQTLCVTGVQIYVFGARS